MKRFLLISIALLAGLALIVGCEKSSEPEPEPDTFDPPTNIAYVTYQDSVKITWSVSEDDTANGFAGYLVYRRENAGFSGLSETDLAALLAQGSPVTGTEITITGLASDKKHYFAVRSIAIDGSDTTLSDLSSTIHTSPTIWFSDTIYKVEYSESAFCAIDFDNQVIYPMELSYLTHIDIYLGLNTSSRLSLRSPDLYSSEWREAEVKRLGGGATSVAEFGSAGSSGWSSEAEVYPGDVYAIKTGSHYSKVFVESIIGASVGIAFTAAYQNVEDYDRF